MKRQCHFSVIINAEKNWELDLFFILHFTYLGGAYAPNAHLPTGLVWGIRDVHIHLVNNRRQ